jgi:hypothetical protein
MVRTIAALGVMLSLCSTARAQEQEQEQGQQQGMERPREASPPLGDVVLDGAFMPFSLPARVGETRAFAWGSGGYDSARKGPVADAVAEVQLWGPIALRGGATYSNDTDKMRPSVGLRAQLLHQATSGIDGALSVFFKTEGFTETEGEIETFVSIGHVFDRTAVMGNLVYGQDPEGNERDGEVRASVIRSAGRFTFGFDSRARSAIGTQHGTAAVKEPKYDATVGALGAVTISSLMFFAEVGPNVVKMPLVSRSFGAIAFAGIGSAF